MQLTTLFALAASVSAFQVKFTNQCSYTINVRAAFGKFVCDLAPGQTDACTQNIGSGVRGIFKHTASDEANLFEYSTINGPGFNFVWYDMSNIPPMPGNCYSYENCKQVTGKTGYNVPVHVTPNNHAGEGSCRKLVDMAPDAPDAYLFPADNTKTHACPMDTSFTVTYCPGNNPKPATCQTYPDTDFGGNDIGRFEVHGSTNDQVGQCCSGCNNNAECLGFAVSGGFCYMKNALANKGNSPGVIAGAKPSDMKCSYPQWNTDLYGNDFDRVPVTGGAWDRVFQCCDACTKRSECAAYTINGDWCYLKNKVGASSYSSTAYSGRRAAP
nr:secreted protein [Achlya hypogyna]